MAGKALCPGQEEDVHLWGYRYTDACFLPFLETKQESTRRDSQPLHWASRAGQPAFAASPMRAQKWTPSHSRRGRLDCGLALQDPWGPPGAKAHWIWGWVSILPH